MDRKSEEGGGPVCYGIVVAEKTLGEASEVNRVARHHVGVDRIVDVLLEFVRGHDA